LRVSSDPLSFTVIETPPGDNDIALVFKMPLENRIGWVLTGLSLAIAAALLTLDHVYRQPAE
jgi:hypothetical protein